MSEPVNFYQLIAHAVGNVAPELVAVWIVMALLLIWRHEGNIRKLLAGTESRIGGKAAAPAAPAAHKTPKTKGKK